MKTRRPFWPDNLGRPIRRYRDGSLGPLHCHDHVAANAQFANEIVIGDDAAMLAVNHFLYMARVRGTQRPNVYGLGLVFNVI